MNGSTLIDKARVLQPERKTDRRFFDPRYPGPRRKNGAALVESFNAAHPIGTVVMVWPLARWMPHSKVTRVARPGAFVNSAGLAVVKIPGDCIALTHVQVLAPTQLWFWM